MKSQNIQIVIKGKCNGCKFLSIPETYGVSIDWSKPLFLECSNSGICDYQWKRSAEAKKYGGES